MSFPKIGNFTKFLPFPRLEIISWNPAIHEKSNFILQFTLKIELRLNFSIFFFKFCLPPGLHKQASLLRASVLFLLKKIYAGEPRQLSKQQRNLDHFLNCWKKLAKSRRLRSNSFWHSSIWRDFCFVIFFQVIYA